MDCTWMETEHCVGSSVLGSEHCVLYIEQGHSRCSVQEDFAFVCSVHCL